MNSAIKVILFCDTYYPVIDGVSLTLKNYAHWLNREHGSCEVVAPHQTGEESANFDYPVHRFASIDTLLFRPYRFGVPLFDTKYKRLMRENKCDLVHAHSPYIAGQQALKYAKKHGVPLVATFHTKFREDFFAATKSHLLSALAVRKAVAFFEKADSVWAVNLPTAQTLREYGYKGEIEIMPNGCDCFFPEDATRCIRKAEKELLIDKNEKIFLFVGRLIWQKNLRTLLEAASLFKNKNPSPFRLFIAGCGAKEKEIKALALELGLDKNVVFTGEIADRELLTGLYLRSLALLFPSVYDNAPLVVREASALHCPCVLIRGSNAAEDFVDGETVFLCDNTPAALCARMEDIYFNQRERDYVAARCAKIVKSWQSVVALAADKYKEIIINYNKKHST